MARARMRNARSTNARSTKRKVQPYRPKVRTGLIISSTMDFGEFTGVEWMLFQEGLTLAPLNCGSQRPGAAHIGSTVVMPSADLSEMENGALAGIVVPGGEAVGEFGGAVGFDKAINTADAEDLPIMAFGDGVGRTLAALGYAPPHEMPPAILLHDGVLILESEAEVREAITPFRAAASPSSSIP